MDIFIINWFHKKPYSQDYIETDEYCFDNYEDAEDYAKAAKATLNKMYNYYIVGLEKRNT